MVSYMQKISRHLFIHVGNARYFVLLPLIMNALRAVLLLICHILLTSANNGRSTAIISPLSSYLRACAVTINRPTVLERSIM
jgi:hypothetical protein